MTKLVGVGVLAMVIVTACLVDRPSNDLKCASTADCAGFAESRSCVRGYCVVPNCPSVCTRCDEAAMTCEVECSSSRRCNNNLRCPVGWSCTITCDGDRACGDIECPANSTCAVTCSGTGSCRNVRCQNACSCDVTCAAGACDSMSCPTRDGARCTVDGMAGSECDSAPAGCGSC